MTAVDVRHPVTPCELHGDIWLKRDDLFEFAGVQGGKVRTCLALCQSAAALLAPGVCTAGSRHSPQVEIVAHVAAALGLRARCHVPAGEDTPQLRSAAAAGAEVVRHRPGHNSVIKARARDDAAALGWLEIPFGMECDEAVRATQGQVANVPPGVRRLVVPVGSGMSLAGITWGVRQYELPGLDILGVRVGADPARRLDRWAHPFWRQMVTLVQAPQGYHEHAQASVGPVELDPVYEAKCAQYLQPGDMLWVVGRRLQV